MKGDVLGSVAEFDKAIELDPRQNACKFPQFSCACFVNKQFTVQEQATYKILVCSFTSETNA